MHNACPNVDFKSLLVVVKGVAWEFASGQTWTLWLLKSLVTWENWLTHHQLILKRIVEAVANIMQLSGIFRCTRQSLRHRRQLCIEVCASTFELLVSTITNYNYYSEYFSGFAWFPNSVTIWRSAALQGRRSDTQLLDSKWLFWFLLSHN